MTRKADLTVVLREGKRARTRFLDVRAMASPLLHPRAGIIVPKRGRTTTDRNRVKRRLRELIRLYLLPGAESMDLVVRARDEAYSASFEDLRLDLMKAADLIGQAFRKGM